MFTRRRLVVGWFASTVVLAGGFATWAFATSSAKPADKVVASGSSKVVMAPNNTSTTGATLLTATMTTSKPEDLSLLVTAECSILTTLENVGTSTANAEGQVRVWTEVDGKIVPIQSTSEPPQNTPPAGTDKDKSVFCARSHKVEFINPSNEDTIKQYEETRNADAFNWVRLNVGAGEHKIVVKADLNSSAVKGTAEAVVGNRTLIVDPTHMANNAIITE
jgi:hypothetical protein